MFLLYIWRVQRPLRLENAGEKLAPKQLERDLRGNSWSGGQGCRARTRKGPVRSVQKHAAGSLNSSIVAADYLWQQALEVRALKAEMIGGHDEAIDFLGFESAYGDVCEYR